MLRVFILGLLALFVLAEENGGHRAPPDGARQQAEEMRRLRAMVMEQQTAIETMKEKHALELKTIKADIQSCKSGLTSYVDRTQSVPATHDTIMYACQYEIINMGCTGGGVVFIVSAAFGQYGFPCGSGQCCAPNATLDCTESMQEYNPSEWTDLKLACNYNEQCGFQFDPHLITTCLSQQVADYLTITYVCSNDQPSSSQLVAFTAYSDSTIYYTTGNYISFDHVITNVGNHYDNDTTFTCPVSGLYFFTFNIQSDYSDEVEVALVMGVTNQLVLTAWSDSDVGYSYPSATQSAFVHCDAGTIVRLYCSLFGDVYSNSDRLSSFSGMLIREDQV